MNLGCFCTKNQTISRTSQLAGVVIFADIFVCLRHQINDKRIERKISVVSGTINRWRCRCTDPPVLKNNQTAHTFWICLVISSTLSIALLFFVFLKTPVIISYFQPAVHDRKIRVSNIKNIFPTKNIQKQVMRIFNSASEPDLDRKQ